MCRSSFVNPPCNVSNMQNRYSDTLKVFPASPTSFTESSKEAEHAGNSVGEENAPGNVEIEEQIAQRVYFTELAITNEDVHVAFSNVVAHRR